MNYDRRKIRPRQPAQPSAPHQGAMGRSGNMSMQGIVGTGMKPMDKCLGAQGQHGSGGKKGY